MDSGEAGSCLRRCDRYTSRAITLRLRIGDASCRWARSLRSSRQRRYEPRPGCRCAIREPSRIADGSSQKRLAGCLVRAAVDPRSRAGRHPGAGGTRLPMRGRRVPAIDRVAPSPSPAPLRIVEQERRLGSVRLGDASIATAVGCDVRALWDPPSCAPYGVRDPKGRGGRGGADPRDVRVALRAARVEAMAMGSG